MKNVTLIELIIPGTKTKRTHVHIYTLFRTCECCNPSNLEVPVAQRVFAFRKKWKSIVMPKFQKHCFSNSGHLDSFYCSVSQK